MKASIPIYIIYKAFLGLYFSRVSLYNSSSRNAQLSQLDNFSFYDSFDESHTVYFVEFDLFSQYVSYVKIKW